MKKNYKKPALNIVKLNAELPMAASAGSIEMNMFSDEIGASQGLSNTEGDFDIWKNDKSIW